jgi:hypothetical protein
MPHLLGVPVWDDGASAPEGADALCPQHLDRVASGAGDASNVMQGCPGGEDIGNRSLRELMPKRTGRSSG